MVITKSEPFSKEAVKSCLASMVMDLLRVSKGHNRGAIKMEQKFLEEADKRREELKNADLDPYIKRILGEVKKLKDRDPQRRAEDALMYSTLLQNYSQKKL